MSDTTERNPHKPETPEWQLFENARGTEQLARAFYADSAKALERAAAATEKAALYRAALKKLADADARARPRESSPP